MLCQPCACQLLLLPYTGLPTDLLDSYPVLRDFHNSIASLPEVAAFYRYVCCVCSSQCCYCRVLPGPQAQPSVSVTTRHHTNLRFHTECTELSVDAIELMSFVVTLPAPADCCCLQQGG